ncbi:MAG: serine/threonine protein kinase, partial [Planctomycetaceae bacterium]
MQFRIENEGAGQDPDPTISRDTAKFWRDKHRVELQTKPDWRLEDLFDDIDDMLSIEASPTDANGQPQRSGENLKRMLLADLIRIEVEVAEATYRARRSLEDYLRALPQYAPRIRQVFTELDSLRDKRSEPDTNRDSKPVGLEVWTPGEWKGRYRLEEKLGQGTYGEVWKATDEEGTFVAIKALRLLKADNQTLESLSRAERKAILRDEGEVLTALTGKNLRVPKYVDFGEHNERPYLVMEYIDGLNLQAARGEREDWGWPRCVRIILSLLETVRELNRNSYYHYDIKPSNVMLDPQDQAWVIDLGSAQSWEQTCAGQLDSQPVFSEQYRPPELWPAKAQSFTAETGIYLVGGVLYFLLTHRSPNPRFMETNDAFKRCEYTPQPPGELHIGLPGWLDTLCLQMLQGRKEKRPKNASEVIEALKRGLAETPSTPAALLDTGRPEVLPDPTAPAAGSRHVVPRLAGWRLTSLVSLLVASALLGLGALSLRGTGEQKPLRMLSPANMLPVSIGENKHHRIPEGPIVIKDGVKFKNSWPTLISVFEATSHPGRFTTSIPMDVNGNVNSIGLAHNRQQEKLDANSLLVYTFTMLKLAPSLTPEDELDWEFSYDKYYSTNPDVPEPGEGPVAEGQLRSTAPEEIHLKTFKVRRRPESPHFRLRL